MTTPDDTDNALALESQLCFALYSTQLAMNKLYRSLLRELDLTYPQYLTMLVLWQRDRQTVSEIGEHLYLDSATLTPLLKRLAAAGLVTRQRSRQDERQVEIALTEQGRSLRERAKAVPQAVGCAGQCTPEEAAELRDALHGLRQRLDSQ
ncbi:MarR family winged helix-turn-helix transcriptional regulator [Salinicola acroporae]|uniref:MarR family transcriptional regulator n=1 Tax=Salinicola acroporae TaxID=1541440 RepID=A0ABT6I1H2_9GAMM|nr:MarR family transcriptional regulator [Salinicola acroporae]MDH4571525.1 MarR family transcriptional regulator [Salinicola acroporae]